MPPRTSCTNQLLTTLCRGVSWLGKHAGLDGVCFVVLRQRRHPTAQPAKGYALKILIVNTLYTPNLIGGAERSVQVLAEGLVMAGHSAVVVSTAPNRGVTTACLNGVRAYYIGLKNLYWPFGHTRIPAPTKLLWHALDSYHPTMVQEFVKVMDKEAPDVVHTNNLSGFSPLLWQGVKARRLPLVHTLRDYYLLCPQVSMFRGGKDCECQCPLCRLYSLPKIRFSRHVDVVVGISRFILKRHRDHGCFDGAQQAVISNAYELKALDTKRTLPSTPLRFGYLGRLSPEKGVERLLEAATRLPSAKWTLDVGGQGSGTYENGLRSRYGRPNIRFLGDAPPTDFFSAVDVLVVPSLWHEPFGRVVIEAYAHGVPVIASARGGLSDLVSATTGLLFDPDMPGELEAKMQRLINEPARVADMSRHCLKEAQRFLPRAVVNGYLEVYSRVSQAPLATRGKVR